MTKLYRLFLFLKYDKAVQIVLVCRGGGGLLLTVKSLIYRTKFKVYFILLASGGVIAAS